jgi:hypothetical protein
MQLPREHLERVWNRGIINLSGYAAEALMGRQGEDCTAEGLVEFFADNEPDPEIDDFGNTINMFYDSGIIRFIMHEKEGKRLRWLAPYRKRLKNKSIEKILMEDTLDFLRDKTHHIQNIADALLEKFKDEKIMALLSRNEIIEIMGTRPSGRFRPPDGMEEFFHLLATPPEEWKAPSF